MPTYLRRSILFSVFIYKLMKVRIEFSFYQTRVRKDLAFAMKGKDFVLINLFKYLLKII